MMVLHVLLRLVPFGAILGGSFFASLRSFGLTSVDVLYEFLMVVDGR